VRRLARQTRGHTALKSRPKLFSIKRRSAPGAPPGTLIAPVEAEPTMLDVIAYSPTDCVERTDADFDLVKSMHAQPGVLWVNLIGLDNTGLIAQLADLFGLHQLAVEDVLNLHQRPKIEEFDEHFFIVVRMVGDNDSDETEQVSMFLGDDFVFSIQERPGDCFDPIRERIRKAKGLIRGRGPDYLCYALIDAVVDGYFPVLESLGERLEALEDEVVREPAPDSIERLHDMKRVLLALRRIVWPHRDLLHMLSREEHPLLARTTRVYLRDSYDHTIQLMDILETYRETASGLVDVYISSASAKLNEIMKVLTIIATIFMPLGFIASLYGMNFDRSVSSWNMPELGWRFGYPFALGLMAACVGFLVYYFRRRGWFAQMLRADSPDRKPPE
jgi:magnesium transporter